MIELKNVSKYYNNNGVVNLGLHNINLKLNKNEIVAIVGDSGSGKSTLLNVICGVDSYEDGEMYFKGNETSYFNQSDMDIYRKKHVGFIFQNYNIIDSYTVLDNVMMPMILNGVSTEEAKERAKKLIDKVGLSHRINNRGTKLSGGEKQRCVIARALASDCDILACDEPTGNLDSATGKEIIKIIKEVAADKLVLIVTHNYEEVEDIVTRRIKIADGTVVEDHIIAQPVDDANEEVSFEDDSIKRASLLKMVFKNIKSTPKKTFFTFVVFLFISLIAFYLYLSCMASSEVSVFNPDVSFVNFEYNRLIIFNQDHSPIENDAYKTIEGDYVVNAFYEDISVPLTITNENYKNSKEFSVAYTTKKDMKYELILGTNIVAEKDAFIILPKENLDYYSLMVSSYVNGYIMLLNTQYNIVGIGTSEYVKTPVLMTGDDASEKFCSVAYKTEVSAFYIDNETQERVEIARRSITVSKPTVYLPSKYMDSDYSFEFYLGDMYKLVNPKVVDIRYTYGSDNFFFAMPSNYQYKFEDIYEITVYADRPNDAYNKLESYGYTVLRPSIDFTEVSQNQLLYIAYVAISIIIIMVLGFVSYTIISRIYISKNKDYTVFRTLGVVKNKMSFIVRAEITIISLVASVVAYGLIYLLYYLFHFEYLNVVVYNRFSVSLIYYITVFLFTNFVAKRFNKRLFKFSVQTSFKGEVVRND